MEDLPEEILERIIENALPSSASVMRNARGIGGHQRLFHVSKQFHRIARDVFYSRPLVVYITRAYEACDVRFPRSFWLTSIWPPWERFRTIKLHFHPEISFLTIDRHREDVLRQMDHRSIRESSGGIWAEAYRLAKVMSLAGLPQLVEDRKLDIKIRFHDTCPFHDRMTYADTEYTPPYHIPLWDHCHIHQILEGFRWLLAPIESLPELRQVVTFPHIAWATPHSNLNDEQLGTDFIFNLTLLDMWAGANEKGRAIVGRADRQFPGHRRYNSSLQGFVDSFDTPGYSSYSISPGGKVHKLEPNSIRNLRNLYGDLNMLMSRWSWDTYKWDHEINVVQTVLIDLREQLDSIHAELPRSQSRIWQSMVLHARMEAFSEVFAYIAIEWDGCSTVQGPRTHVRDDDQRRTAVRAQLNRLESWGLWDGKWEDLRNANCHVVEADAKLERFWCKCGTEIDLDVREVVIWKEKNGIDHHELLEQMRGTQFAEDMIQGLQLGGWSKRQ